MLTCVEAVVEKGRIRLLEDIPLDEGVRLVVTVLPLREDARNSDKEWRDPIEAFIGLGKEAWKGIDPDEYIAELREGWE